MTMSSPTLIPLTWSPADISLLASQRDICGYGTPSIPYWREACSQSLRTVFWICLPASPNPPSGTAIITHEGNDYLAVGHIALDRTDVAGIEPFEREDSLTAEDGSVLTITILFVHPAFSKRGFASSAVRQLEGYARAEPYGSENCRAVTVHCLSPRHTKAGGIEGEEGMGAFRMMGVEPDERSSNGFFERLGYVQYKEIPRYWAPTTEGGKVRLYVVCLRKELDQ